MKLLFFLAGLSTLVYSCSNSRRFTYFKDVPDTVTNYLITDTAYSDLTIKTDDILQVNISSPNPDANNFFVIPGASASNVSGITGNAPVPNTYLVDKTGAIGLPLLGRIKVKDLTTVEASEMIREKVLVYLKDPIITVRFQNFKVTVLGEVNRPASYILPNEKISILDALGMAGDLTAFGRRENVLVIRQREGKKVLTRLDLSSSNIFQSPYYYLQQNDIVYVEPNKSKASNTDIGQIRKIAILTSLASLAVVIITRF